MHETLQLVARGNIAPARFVKLDTATDNGALQAGANEAVIGVAQPGTNYPPLSNLSVSSYAAQDTQTLQVFSAPDVCRIEAGDVITPGDKLKSDSSGRAVPAATTGTTVQNVGAIALEAATAAGQMIRCKLVHAYFRPALA